jgi:hypothetical protein
MKIIQIFDYSGDRIQANQYIPVWSNHQPKGLSYLDLYTGMARSE